MADLKLAIDVLARDNASAPPSTSSETIEPKDHP